MWALFAGVALLGLGHGLQGTLLGVRATREGFDTAVTGLIMTAYYVGFIFGSKFTVRALGRVGHIRVFAALASVASSAALAYILVVTPPVWIIMRLITGFCMAGLYVIMESWLNDSVSNDERGRALSRYMMVTMAAVAGSQVLLAFGTVDSAQLFVVASMLVSLSLVPMALSEASAPEVRVTEPLRLRELWRITPTGVVVIFITGMSVGALRGLGPVFATQVGLSTANIALFVGAITLGASAFQMPIGSLSDRVPRRPVMVGVALGAAGLSLVMSTVDLSASGFVAVSFALGGLAVPMYSLSIAYTNDWLDDDRRISAAALLIIVNGAGAITGPLIGGVVMRLSRPEGLFSMLWVTHAVVAVYLLYRMARTRAPESVPKSRFVPFSNRGAGILTLRAIRSRRTKPPD
jgi:MFS family permease